MDDRGMVETVGYGKGSWFQPFKILPLDEGRKIAKELQKLQAERIAAMERVQKEFVDKRDKLIIVPK